MIIFLIIIYFQKQRAKLRRIAMQKSRVNIDKSNINETLIHLQAFTPMLIILSLP